MNLQPEDWSALIESVSKYLPLVGTAVMLFFGVFKWRRKRKDKRLTSGDA